MKATRQRVVPFVLLVAAAVLCRPAIAADDVDDPASDAYRERLHRRFDDEIAAVSAHVERNPARIELYSRRGDSLFFRGKFSEALRDYDKMVELDPDVKASHWRRGIACFYAARYQDAAKQFEIYHSIDNVDRENGIWRYLSQVKASGKEQARLGLLRYEKDDREPFPDVYRMFAGDRSPAEVLDRIARAEVATEERDKRAFYAELYIGLNDVVEGRAESAEGHLREAVRNRWGMNARGGPGWMWHVARIQHDLLRQAKRSTAP